MRAITHTAHGDSSVLQLTDREIPEPGPGEVRVRVVVSGVNPTDWKSRRRRGAEPEGTAFVPNQDGAGVIDAVGPDVDAFAVGDRVWLAISAYERPLSGTAQEYTVLPLSRVFRLPEAADFSLGAALGVPALTAHRALTVADGGPDRLHPGALAGRTVLVAGGAGAVGNAAIQLARWAGARVITTVSGASKAESARAAGAHHVLNYRDADIVAQIRAIAPDGVDQIVEVAVSANDRLNLSVLAVRGTIAIYADDRSAGFTVDFGRSLRLNVRYQFLLLYTGGAAAIAAGAEDVNAAIRDGAFGIGPDRGIPVHRYSLADTAAAHDAVENGIVGKVLIDL